ncbi:MAG: D-cysteine desulfhydrase family protein [Rhodobacteraceae bacterium]|jgi:L-cysteate sulfo-lyase|uniref:D-cysteine desulfhydrase n=1 Tax=Salipiger profundus TaxID=1229727 RepID=A0A1U7D8K1_9RHOB|nr:MULTISPECIES: D-cysteine desulfhydrase family protein [Salipiger]MAB07193.1 D-cysteine desulfhydrase family protein [Paracoccaceae bacterium]MBQ01611.1 D-cysteine desulfhydrase family protein [Acidobacteriota bacterium]APX24507.1 D-cysteine desulfhydrase [Salipiger profundus]SFD40691.1 D-cysteine desulfhydrase [Salipiger profundus]GGA18987.1 D-cysteine desulfhydrase [Salipiger profundus]
MKDQIDQSQTRLSLAQLPTPLERLERLSDALGLEIWMKRDDLTGFAMGGNKVRKLEYLMLEAIRARADTVLTSGALQSNHARQTAAAAARLGLSSVLVLAEAVQGRTATYASGGNLVLDRLVGSDIRRVPHGEDPAAVIETTVRELEAKGRKVFVIPVGGSNVTGALGYRQAAQELDAQLVSAGVEATQIVMASGSGGTQAGLVLGTATPVLGVSVSSSEQELSDKVRGIVAEAVDTHGFTEALDRKITVDDGFVGAGYGQPTEAMHEAVTMVARLEGIFLDPVYSGKAMAGLVSLARDGALRGPVVFLHTGGSPALFAYDDAF